MAFYKGISILCEQRVVVARGEKEKEQGNFSGAIARPKSGSATEIKPIDREVNG
jgi:hypothetical protein